MYELEREFSDYQYLGKRIIKEIEFSYLYCNKYRCRKCVKKLINVLREYIGNHKENYDILKEYLHWLRDGNNELLFDAHTNFELSPKDIQGFSANIEEWIQGVINYCDENRKETTFWVQTGNLIPWTAFTNLKPVDKEVITRSELNKLIAGNITHIQSILRDYTPEEKKKEQLIGKL
jgi:hypothetical protein